MESLMEFIKKYWYLLIIGFIVYPMMKKKTTNRRMRSMNSKMPSRMRMYSRAKTFTTRMRKMYKRKNK